MIECNPERKTILVVDDSPENITILKKALGREYDIRPAVHGRSALKAASIDPPPDLILLDVMMPEMDGYAVCRHLKSDSRTRDIPVIFVTGKAQEADELQGLELGAVDYITKPFSLPIVLARVKTHLALREAQHTIENQNNALRTERELIENIVLRMRSADHLDGRHLRYLFSPVEQTAGDLILSAFAPDGRQLVLLGDFTGHGLPAAIGGPLVSYIFMTLVMRGEQAPTLFREINNQLESRLPTGIFFASCLVEVEKNRRGITVLNAGLHPCLVIRGQTKILEITSQFHPLGITRIDQPINPTTPVNLEPGDKIYLLTDGIVEACSKNGNMFDNHRLEAFLTNQVALGSPLEAIFDVLRDFCATHPYEDDITLVEIQL
ncbi:MAG: SpoIIE family protein phosphatase [Magnetococcales bacterium]|nr:SpoIIE family protein phosphatase [Magnetococcales bacterium]MBF0322225.1 SpoIIE family protein phosphatase [Magnetococcales bacterium]